MELAGVLRVLSVDVSDTASGTTSEDATEVISRGGVLSMSLLSSRFPTPAEAREVAAAGVVIRESSELGCIFEEPEGEPGTAAVVGCVAAAVAKDSDVRRGHDGDCC